MYKRQVLRVEQRGQQVWLGCSPEDYEHTWRAYFDLGEDYAPKREALAAMSPALAEAAAFAPGIRILRQEPWEALCSFILSQNNHIPRIKGIIERLCQRLGAEIPGTAWHAFPTAERLAACSLEDLVSLRAGFRAKYLLDAARKLSLIHIFKVTSTPNLLFSLETATSRCCSPRPLKIISWVSLLVLNCKVGSSSERRIMPWATLSSSPFLAGTMAMRKVGLGYSTPSKVTFRVGEHRVSPVLVAVSLDVYKRQALSCWAR